MLFMAGRPKRWVSSPSNECLLIFALKKGTVFSPGDTLSLLLITFNFSGELLSISCRSTTSKLKITEGSHLRKQKSLREFKIKSLKSHCGWLNACEILHQWGMVETCWNHYNQWIGLRDHLLGKSTVSCRCSLKPIHWYKYHIPSSCLT